MRVASHHGILPRISRIYTNVIASVFCEAIFLFASELHDQAEDCFVAKTAPRNDSITLIHEIRG